MKTLVLIAIPEEAPDLKHLDHVFYTGVGKVNAAITASRLIALYQPNRVINFGTAGGINVVAGLHKCTQFVQRDMTCQALGCVLGQTPFETAVHIGNTGGLVCSTGDDFVMNPNLEIPADLVDMEAYAIAKACQMYQVEFLCWKYVSDRADSKAHDNWRDSVADGQSYYIQQLKELSLY